MLELCSGKEKREGALPSASTARGFIESYHLKLETKFSVYEYSLKDCQRL